VVFLYDSENEQDLACKIEKLIKDKFGLKIPVFVTDIENILDNFSFA